MIPSWITLNAAASRISARFSGGLVTASFRMSLGGSISPGTYSVSAPMHNSVYGVFAILSLRQTSKVDWIARPGVQHNVGWIASPSAQYGTGWIERPGNKPSVGWITGPGRQASAGWIEGPLSTEGSGVFVLVEKSVPKRNAILVTSGFGQLMGGLQQSGGGTVTVV